MQNLDYFRAREHAVNGPVGVENIKKPYQKSGQFSRPVLIILLPRFTTNIGPFYWSGPPKNLLGFYRGKGGT